MGSRSPAVTHAFDQDQRYVPLTILSSDTSGAIKWYKMQVPSDSQIVIPGPYMLFAVKGDGTPARARWVWIGSAPPTEDTHDRVRPGRTTDLSAGEGAECGTIDIGWVGWGDDSTFRWIGPAKTFDLRYRTTSICDSCWASFGGATQISGEPAVGVFGQTYSTTLTGFMQGSTLQFRLVSYDDRSSTKNMSAMSNAATVVLPWCDPGLVVDGGGNAGQGSGIVPGESGGIRPPSHPRSTLLSRLVPGAAGVDRVRVVEPALAPDGLLHVRLRQSDGGSAEIRGVRLLAIERGPQQQTFPLGENFLLGERIPSSSARRQDGASFTDQVAGNQSSAFVGDEGDTLTITLPALVGSDSAVVIETAGGRGGLENPGDGIVIQTRTGGGAWTTLDTHTPLSAFTQTVFGSVGANEMRLCFRGNYAVSFVGRIGSGAAAAVPTDAALNSVTPDGQDALPPTAFDQQGLVLGANRGLDLAFVAPAAEAGPRDWYLEIEGTRHVSASAAPTSGPPANSLPTAFALEQNRPNPFGHSTIIEFALPVASDVRLELFDLQGRRVAMLAKGTHKAGLHIVEWDGRTGRGAIAPPGIYLYRLIAGSFRDEKRLTLLP